MTNSQEKVWYACYGSNLLEDRFHCYIKGGKPKGARTNYEGCRDKTLPTENEDFFICAKLYFARESSNWNNGGVAFISTKFEAQTSTFGRIYLVTRGQLIDIARQETNTKTEISIDFEKAIKEGSYIFKPSSWYGNLLYLGNQNDHPIFTLTNEDEKQPYTKPSKNYVKTICEGIRQTHDFDNTTIFEYLRTKDGINENYQDQELLNIVSE